MLVVGSQALEFFVVRDPKDHDYLCSEKEFQEFLDENEKNILLVKEKTLPFKGAIVHMMGFAPIEFEFDDTTQELLDIVYQNDELYWTDDLGTDYAGLHVLYALKMSHRFFKNSPHFLKTMGDIHAIRELTGTKEIHPLLKDWYSKRVKATYFYKHPNLSQNKDSFFKDDNINYVYDHDTIHEAVKTFDKPAFQFIKKDAAEVFCSKEKFEEASMDIKLATVLEESYVLALERHQIPNEFKPDPDRSFKIALEKVCTSIACGWWRDFAWEHYHQVLALYNRDYVDKFKKALQNGVIAPY